MTFDELKKIRDEAQSAEWGASRAKSASHEIGTIRRSHSMPELDDVVIPFTDGYGTNRRLSKEAANEVRQATLDLLPDILRLAELRLDAKRKHQSTLAHAKNTQVADFLGEPPCDDP